MRRYRARLKENEETRKNYLEKDAARKRIERAKERKRISQDNTLIKIKRKKETERKRKYREKIKSVLKEKKNEKSFSDLGPYKCRQTLGKALNKVKRVLPQSPARRVAVVKHLAIENVPDLISSSNISSKGKKPISDAVRTNIINFFTRDDISRQAPGKRDTKSVKNAESGKREIFQKRHLTMTVKEAFSLYKNENPGTQVALSKFYDLRPKHVLLSSEMPHNVCVCRYHANFNYIVQSIHEKIEAFPPSGSTLLNFICCDTMNEKCMINNCSNCEYNLGYALLPLQYICSSDTINIKWRQWQDVNGRPQSIFTESSLTTAIYYLEQQLYAFKIHCYVKRVQERYFDLKKQTLQANEVLLQLDFAENYSLISQDEIQSAHWSHKQVTIFTCVAWLADATYSFAIISNDLSHSKYSVYAFIKEIVHQLQTKSKNVNKIIIFSDGCAAQFKNRYTLSNLCHMEHDCGVGAEWNFFATSHGKGAVDAVGGLIKRLVWTEIRSRRVDVGDAYTFYMCAKNKVNNINVIYIDNSETEKYKEMLDERWKNVRKINQIQAKHHFQKIDNCRLLTKRTSNSNYEICEVFYIPN